MQSKESPSSTFDTAFRVVLFKLEDPPSSAVVAALQNAGHAATATDSAAEAIRVMGANDRVLLVIGRVDQDTEAVFAATALLPREEAVVTVIVDPADSTGSMLSVQEIRVGRCALSGSTRVACAEVVEHAHAVLLSMRGMYRCGNTFLFFSDSLLVTSEGQLHLAPAEAALLRLLMIAYPRPVSREEIQERLVGFVPEIRTSAPRSRIHALRRRLIALKADIEIVGRRSVGWQLQKTATIGASVQNADDTLTMEG